MRQFIWAFAFVLIGITTFGQTWKDVGNGLGYIVYDLQPLDDNLYAVSGGVKHWDGNVWKSLPFPLGVAPLTLSVFNDTLYVGGDHTASNSISRVYSFNGTDWIQAGGDFVSINQGFSATKTLLRYNGYLVSGGSFNEVNGLPMDNVAAWDGITWKALGNGLNSFVWHLAEHDGFLYATGSFTASGSDSTVRYLGKWDGVTWSPLDSNYLFPKGGTVPAVRPIIGYDSLLIIGNLFDTINGNPMMGVAARDGDEFISMGNILIKSVTDFFVFDDELYMCGELYTLHPHDHAHVVLKWDTYRWHQVGVEFDDRVISLGEYRNDLYCGGFFENQIQYVARLDPATGIPLSEESKSFSVYPNPSSGLITVNTIARGELRTLNQLGSEVHVAELFPGQTKIDLKGIPTGIYYLQLEVSGNLQTQKLIIQR